MKKILILTVLLSLGVFTACSDDDSRRFSSDEESGWVQFRNSATLGIMFMEDGKVSIPVDLKSPVNTSGLQVDYAITNIVGTTNGVLSFDNKVVFDKATNTSSIVMNMLGANLASVIEFDVTLSGTSRSNVTVGIVDSGANLKPIVKRIRICPSDLVTNYRGTSVVEGEEDFFGPWTPTMTIVPGDTKKFEVSTLWGDGFVDFLTGGAATGYVYPGFITINSDNTVVVTNVTNTALYPGGTGTYDPCTRVIKYNLRQGLFNGTFQVAVVLTPN
ncbi:hypothetical protein ACFSX9_15180 [Flavobacterium ardleyense]|uniref:Lipoprotein n=1 Tax=Flavobacterium ardleyense TaxID=2038737 RepID=A0ABW5ZC48_9FLAO